MCCIRRSKEREVPKNKPKRCCKSNQKRPGENFTGRYKELNTVSIFTQVFYASVCFFFRFNRTSVIGSINIPFSSVSFSENKIENVGQHSSALKNARDKIVVIIGNEETDLELVRKHIKY